MCSPHLFQLRRAICHALLAATCRGLDSTRGPAQMRDVPGTNHSIAAARVQRRCARGRGGAVRGNDNHRTVQCNQKVVPRAQGRDATLPP